MAAAECIKGRRFAAACGALSSFVKKAAAAAAAEEARLAAPVILPLMPGADVSVEEEQDAGPAPASGAAHARMTIFYGGRVVILDEFPVDRAAELLRVAAEGTAAAQGADRRGELADDLPMARKASLQRFMEKRKSRLAARGVPYRRPGGDA